MKSFSKFLSIYIRLVEVCFDDDFCMNGKMIDDFDVRRLVHMRKVSLIRAVWVNRASGKRTEQRQRTSTSQQPSAELRTTETRSDSRPPHQHHLIHDHIDKQQGFT